MELSCRQAKPQGWLWWDAGSFVYSPDWCLCFQATDGQVSCWPWGTQPSQPGPSWIRVKGKTEAGKIQARGSLKVWLSALTEGGLC